MGNIIFNHNPDWVKQEAIQNGETITLKANSGKFRIYFKNPEQFNPKVNNPIILTNQSNLDLSQAGTTEDSYINFDWICEQCENPISRPAKIIVGTVRCDDPLDRIENKLDGLISEIKKIEQSLNIDN